MFEYCLFFAFRLNEQDRNALNKVPNLVKDLFISNRSSDYLQVIEVDGNFYLGKFLAECFSSAALETIGKNIHSLIKRLLPGYPFDESSLILLSVLKEC